MERCIGRFVLDASSSESPLRGSIIEVIDRLVTSGLVSPATRPVREDGVALASAHRATVSPKTASLLSRRMRCKSTCQPTPPRSHASWQCSDHYHHRDLLLAQTAAVSGPSRRARKSKSVQITGEQSKHIEAELSGENAPGRRAERWCAILHRRCRVARASPVQVRQAPQGSTAEGRIATPRKTHQSFNDGQP